MNASQWFSAAPSRMAAAVLLACFAGSAAAQDDDLETQEEQAIQAAVARVASSVVRIETVGGLETIGSGRKMMRVGAGPTTGLVVSADGYIISSAFNFVQKPTRILVGLPDGSRVPAAMVATDHNRMLTLLKVNLKTLDVDSLNVPPVAPRDEMRIGQWAIAVGRTFDAKIPNVSVGVVSALNRMWGKAIQTDAAISPSNYGGPLIDIRGRAQGILVPLSPQGTTEVAGVEWYDSGIGFAIPLEDVMKTLPRLKTGKDLHRGIMGISFGGNKLTDVPVVAAVRAASPAAEAGMKVGDKIVEVDGKTIARSLQLRHALGPKYAGDEVAVTVLRKDERIPLKVTLTDKLEPFQHPFLGILPRRDANNQPDGGGVAVRFVYPKSPAEAAGLKPGDVVTKADGRAVADAAALREVMNGLKFNAVAKIEFQRNGESHVKNVRFAALPDAIPGDLPKARTPRDELPAERPPVGLQQEQKIAEFKNSYAVYVPEKYDPDAPHGVLLWLHQPGVYKLSELVARWKPLCDQHDLILAVPKWSDAKRWQPQETGFLQKVVEELIEDYNIDRNRVATGGNQAGGVMAFRLAFEKRDLFRAVIAVNAPVAGFAPGENEPTQRLAVLMASAAKAPKAREIAATVGRLKAMKFPVT
ncbi:MAG: PDZ domain-containing protein, partial [Planctomycetales bacterium]